MSQNHEGRGRPLASASESMPQGPHEQPYSRGPHPQTTVRHGLQSTLMHRGLTSATPQPVPASPPVGGYPQISGKCRPFPQLASLDQRNIGQVGSQASRRKCLHRQEDQLTLQSTRQREQSKIDRNTTQVRQR